MSYVVSTSPECAHVVAADAAGFAAAVRQAQAAAAGLQKCVVVFIPHDTLRLVPVARVETNGDVTENAAAKALCGLE